MEAKFEELKGKIITKIEGLNAGNDSVIFTTNDGTFGMYHSQNCCESVTIDDVNGNINDLIGSPILIAEENTSDKNPPGITVEYQNSFTWTFYKLATKKGYVDIRWYGSSNGYYSESVDFKKLDSYDNF
jgi:hypothetical protein